MLKCPGDSRVVGLWFDLLAFSIRSYLTQSVFALTQVCSVGL